MAKNRKVAFGRVTRRLLREEYMTLQMRPFREDMMTLVESHETEAEFDGHRWIAADMSVDSTGNFVTGTLGFSDVEQLKDFDEEAWSWIKGHQHDVEGASPKRTMVPFAIDLREPNQWVAFVLAPRIRVAGFSRGLQACLQRAVEASGLVPAEWRVSAIPSFQELEVWLDAHEEVFRFRRIVRLPNPQRDLAAEHAEIRALAAAYKNEEFVAPYGDNLDLRGTEEFQQLLFGWDTGDVEVELVARSRKGEIRYKSTDMAEVVMVDDFGVDFERGMQVVLDELREYANRRAAAGFGHGNPDDAERLDL